MRKSIISLLFLLWCQATFGFTDPVDVKYDSSAVEWRSFDAQKIAEHKADPDFDYGNRPVPGLSLWDRFRIWLNGVLNRLFYMGTNTPIGKIIVYILIGAIIIYAILKLMRADVRKSFYAEADSPSAPYEIHKENIHEMDFESLIKTSIDAGEFKKAIRLIYLYALKNLSDQHLIEWQPGKTNHDYLLELKEENIRKGFGSLSFYFEYAWYGDFEISKELFANVNQLFRSWKKELPG